MSGLGVLRPSGNKCKFSHDLNVGRKVDKANIYADTREAKSKGQLTSHNDVGFADRPDLMETWDEAKLREVVNQQGSKQKNATDVSPCRDLQLLVLS